MIPRLKNLIALTLISVSAVLSANEPSALSDDSLQLKFDWMGMRKAKLKRPVTGLDQRIGYSKFTITPVATNWTSDNGEEEINVSFGLSSSKLEWNETSHFTQRRVKNFILGFNSWTQTPCDMRLGTDVTLELDTEYRTFCEYARIMASVFVEKELPTGSKGYVGIHLDEGRDMTRYYPVIGICHNFSPQLKLFALWPHKGEVSYFIDSNWMVSAYIEAMRDRERVQPNQNLSKGIWEVTGRNVGLNVRYKHSKIWSAYAKLGFTNEMDVRVYNSYGHHLETHRIKSTPVLSAGVDLCF